MLGLGVERQEAKKVAAGGMHGNQRLMGTCKETAEAMLGDVSFGGAVLPKDSGKGQPLGQAHGRQGAGC